MVFSTEVPGVLTDVMIVFTLVAGTAFIMWMGELITQRGVGNGMSLIIFVSIVSRVPSAIFSSVNLTADLGMGIADDGAHHPGGACLHPARSSSSSVRSAASR